MEGRPTEQPDTLKSFCWEFGSPLSGAGSEVVTPGRWEGLEEDGEVGAGISQGRANRVHTPLLEGCLLESGVLAFRGSRTPSTSKSLRSCWTKCC